MDSGQLEASKLIFVLFINAGGQMQKQHLFVLR